MTKEQMTRRETIKKVLKDIYGENPDKSIINKSINAVLDEIRAEIEEMKIDVDLDIGNEMIYNNAIKDVLQIIDKYKAESEDEE